MAQDLHIWGASRGAEAHIRLNGSSQMACTTKGLKSIGSKPAYMERQSRRRSPHTTEWLKSNGSRPIFARKRQYVRSKSAVYSLESGPAYTGRQSRRRSPYTTKWLKFEWLTSNIHLNGWSYIRPDLHIWGASGGAEAHIRRLEPRWPRPPRT